MKGVDHLENWRTCAGEKCFLPRHCIWLMVKAHDEAKWTCVVAEVFWMVGLGSSSLFPAQSMEGLGLSLSISRLAGISTTGEGIS